jgi:uncharacterized protein YlxW (UPF0749 family)
MSLLADVMNNTLDEAYAERAAHKAGLPDPAEATEQPPGARRGRIAGIATLVLLGLLTGIAIGEVRERAADSAGLRDGLTAEVTDRAAEGDRLAQQASVLRAELATTRDVALGADVAGRAAADAVRALELAAGTTPVTGPGVVLTLDDAPTDGDGTSPPRLRGGTPAVSRVNDRDLQSVVNGLWGAGAEAVAVNDVRLSSRSAIRSAGEAVLVDFQPLSPPYVVTAVGRPADLEVGFVDGPAGRTLQALTQLTGITSSLERSDEVALPGATESDLRAVRLPDPAGGPP